MAPRAISCRQSPWVPCCGPAQSRVAFLRAAHLWESRPRHAGTLRRAPPYGPLRALQPGALVLRCGERPVCGSCRSPRQTVPANSPTPPSSSPAWQPGDPETCSEGLHFEFSFTASGLLRSTLGGCSKVRGLGRPIIYSCKRIPSPLFLGSREGEVSAGPSWDADERN